MSSLLSKINIKLHIRIIKFQQYVSNNCKKMFEGIFEISDVLKNFKISAQIK